MWLTPSSRAANLDPYIKHQVALVGVVRGRKKKADKEEEREPELSGAGAGAGGDSEK